MLVKLKTTTIILLIIAIFYGCSNEPDFRNSHWGDTKEEVSKTEKLKSLKYSNQRVEVEGYLISCVNGLHYKGIVSDHPDVDIYYYFDNDDELVMSEYDFFDFTYISKDESRKLKGSNNASDALRDIENMFDNWLNYEDILAKNRELKKDSDIYFSQFIKLKKDLTRIYGKPSSGGAKKRNGCDCDKLSDEELKLDFSVASGCYAYQVTWNTWSTKILLKFIGSKNNINLNIRYFGNRYIKDFLSEALEQKEKESHKGL